MSFIDKNDGFLKSLVRLQQNLFFIFDQNLNIFLLNCNFAVHSFDNFNQFLL